MQVQFKAYRTGARSNWLPTGYDESRKLADGAIFIRDVFTRQEQAPFFCFHANSCIENGCFIGFVHTACRPILTL